MAHNWVTVGVYFMELVIAYVFFSLQGGAKRKTWVCWTIGAILFSAGMLEYILFPSVVWLSTLCYGVILFLFGVLAFDISWGQALFDAIILDILSTVWDFASISVVSFFTKTEAANFSDQPSYYLINAVVSKTLYFISCIVLAKYTGKDRNAVRFPLIFYLFPFAVLAVLVAFWSVCTSYGISGWYLLFLAVLGMILMLAAVLLFVSFQRTAQRENQIISLQNQLEKIETDKRYYDILEKQNEDLMIYAHDTKKHLSAIRELNDNPQIETYLSKMSERLRRYSRIGHSGNRMLDVICNKYSEECALHGIQFELDLRLANFKYVDDLDLVAIFGNLLDNALEAAQKSTEKKMALLTDRVNTYDIVTVTNSCDRPPLTRGRELLTTKTNVRLHGLGVKSLKKTAHKYGGDCDWYYDTELRQFSMTVMLLNRTDSSKQP